MGAPKGNKNAEKWSEDDAISLFNRVIEVTKCKTSYNVNGKWVDGYLCHFIGEAADEAETSTDILDYLRDKYSLNYLYNRIKRKCERNCFTDSKKGIIVASMAIVNLKSNHGWTDRVDNTSKGNEINTKPIQIQFVKKEE